MTIYADEPHIYVIKMFVSFLIVLLKGSLASANFCNSSENSIQTLSVFKITTSFFKYNMDRLNICILAMLLYKYYLRIVWLAVFF